MTQRKGPPTEMQQDFYVEWAKLNFDPKKKTLAAKNAGYKEPAHAASRALLSSRANDLLRFTMDRKGLTLGVVIDKMKVLLNAVNYKIKDSLTGLPVPDFEMQYKAVELALRAWNAMPPTKIEVDKREVSQHFISLQKMREIEEYTGKTLIEHEDIIEGELIEESRS